jgi:oxygen-independent coproporphyrinogen-3 oxidase
MFPPPRAAYVHVPFCAHRCGYCNFTLVAGRDELVEPYLRAVEIELSSLGSPREVDTLFFGGGTPTRLAPSELDRLLAMATRWFPLAHGGEWSVEANPADLDPARCDVLVRHGVTRISLGVQSFRAAKLELLERDHRAEDIGRAVNAARRFAHSVSLDLIFAAPGETHVQWRDDLAAALAVAPDHLSTYGLTFEKGTAFWSRLRSGQLAPPAEETQRAMYETAMDTLAAAGFEHYEVSNFARPGHRCRHNEAYWLGEGYYAAGPGAARYVDGRRETNHRSTTTYLRRVLSGKSPVADRETLDAESRARELFVFAMRRLEGVDRTWFEHRSGFSVDALLGPALARFAAQGVVYDDGRRVRLTREGLLVSDSLWPRLLTA